MRRILVLAVLAVFIGIQFFRPERSNPLEAADLTLFAQVPVPPNVARILQTSCLDCHSDRTRWPWYSNVAPVSWFVARHVDHGRAEMNFSRWAELTDYRAQKLFDEICEEVESGRMPEPRYLWLHREAKLNEQDKEALCAWSRRHGDRLRQQLER